MMLCLVLVRDIKCSCDLTQVQVLGIQLATATATKHILLAEAQAYRIIGPLTLSLILQESSGSSSILG